jgi:hypothetical protein
LQLRLAKGPVPGRVANVEKAREYLWRLADVYDRMACFPHAEAQLRELMEMDLTKEQRLEALCFLADIQVSVSKIADMLAGSTFPRCIC